MAASGGGGGGGGSRLAVATTRHVTSALAVSGQAMATTATLFPASSALGAGQKSGHSYERGSYLAGRFARAIIGQRSVN